MLVVPTGAWVVNFKVSVRSSNVFPTCVGGPRELGAVAAVTAFRVLALVALPASFEDQSALVLPLPPTFKKFSQ